MTAHETILALFARVQSDRDHWRDMATEERNLVAERDRTIAQLRDVNRTLSEDALTKRSAPPSPAVNGIVIDDGVCATFWRVFNEHCGPQTPSTRAALTAAITSAQLVPLASATPVGQLNADNLFSDVPADVPLFDGCVHAFRGLPQPSQAQEGVKDA